MVGNRQPKSQAKKSDVINVRALTKFYSEQAARRKQAMLKRGPIMTPSSRVDFKRTGDTMKIPLRNATDRPLRLILEVVGRDEAYTIPSNMKDVTLQPKEQLNVPAIFKPAKTVCVMTLSKVYHSMLHIRESDSKTLVASVSLSGIAPGANPSLLAGCMVTATPSPSAPTTPYGWNPPIVHMRRDPELIWPGDTVTLSWSTMGADQISWAQTQEAWVLPDGTAGDSGTWPGPWWSPDQFPATRDDILWGTDRTTLYAKNEYGVSSRTVTVYEKLLVGYYNACITACGIYESEITRIRNRLQDIDAKLNAGCIRNNPRLARFNAPYLTASPPNQNLTDDILAAMKDVVIITHNWVLPDAWGTDPEIDGKLLGPGIIGVLGDELCLLHELYHVVTNPLKPTGTDTVLQRSDGSFYPVEEAVAFEMSGGVKRQYGGAGCYDSG